MDVENRDRFLARTSELGVLDVRCAASGCILVVAASDTDGETMDAIRLLAAVEWPDRPIMVSRRVSVRQSGTMRRPEMEPLSPSTSSDAEKQTG